jgi:hypothetical protein
MPQRAGSRGSNHLIWLTPRNRVSEPDTIR